MKYVTIVVPAGETNLSSITGSFEILTRANEFWKKRENKSLMEVRIAGFAKEMKLDEGYFSLHPIQISEIKKTDLIIIPSVSYNAGLFSQNIELIDWIKQEYKSGAEIAS